MAIKDDMEDVQEAVINELITSNGLETTLDDGEVITSTIADGAVTLAKLGIDVDLDLADDEVTTAKIDDDAVTPAKLDRAYLESTGGDVSGNLLVGTTVSNPTSSAVNTAGQEFSDTGGVRSTVASNAAATFNRKTNDGDVVIIRKDGSTVGTIAADGGDMSIGTGVCGIAFNDAVPTIFPNNQSTLAASDGNINLGASNARYKDLYLSGTIILSGIPTSSSGLPSGAIYSDGGTLKIV